VTLSGSFRAYVASTRVSAAGARAFHEQFVDEGRGNERQTPCAGCSVAPLRTPSSSTNAATTTSSTSNNSPRSSPHSCSGYGGSDAHAEFTYMQAPSTCVAMAGAGAETAAGAFRVATSAPSVTAASRAETSSAANHGIRSLSQRDTGYLSVGMTQACAVAEAPATHRTLS
jgi:hypothetical protein